MRLWNKILLTLVIYAVSIITYAASTDPTYQFFPNIYTQQLELSNKAYASSLQQTALNIAKKVLTAADYKNYYTFKIRLIYMAKQPHTLKALIVYLLSNQYKSIDLVRINLNNNLTIQSIIK